MLIPLCLSFIQHYYSPPPTHIHTHTITHHIQNTSPSPHYHFFHTALFHTHMHTSILLFKSTPSVCLPPRCPLLLFVCKRCSRVDFFQKEETPFVVNAKAAQEKGDAQSIMMATCKDESILKRKDTINCLERQ